MLQRGAILSGKYRIDSVLGEGGMAVVYAVTHLRNTARLAVKVLHQDSLLKGHIRARFVREGRVANSVNHPGAVQMLDDGIAEDGSPYLVMEHLNGVCVAALGAPVVPLSAALNIAYQVLDVLRAAHAHGIIHRDIKPANLFVLRDGRVKVLDFGISRLHDGGEPFDSAATGAVMGTPFFMAPEQARADADAIDTRTDLFAVGASLFTLISGKFLHTGDESRQVMMQAATKQARSLASVAPGTPQAVIDLVAKAVAYDRALRWESAESMQAAVRQVHEALFGPIGFEALASLLLVREFRRKSHAKLTGPLSALRWASDRCQPSPLSTTLPALAAVADVTRSRESFRVAGEPAPNSEAPSSRLSAGPSELAGWTGQVPAPIASKPVAVMQRASRFGASLSMLRVARLAVFSGAICTALWGFHHFQSESEPPSAAVAKPALRSELPAPTRVRAVEPALAADSTVLAGPAPAAQQPRARRSLPANVPVRASALAGPSSKPVSAAPPSTPPTRVSTSAPERLNDLPTLISLPEPFVH